jgi:hypothetical protein
MNGIEIPYSLGQVLTHREQVTDCLEAAAKPGVSLVIQKVLTQLLTTIVTGEIVRKVPVTI